MKKSEYIRYGLMRMRGETPKGGWGRVFGVGQLTCGKLSNRAAEGKLARPVGVVSKAFIQMQKNQRGA